jgi:hypothetical protein
MGKRIIEIERHEGYAIYESANTHPNCKTKAVFSHIDWPKAKRFRYVRGNPASKARALVQCRGHIDTIITLPKDNK